MGISDMNYRNTIQVADSLRSALMRYKDFKIAVMGGNDTAATTYLKEAGILSYSAMEHGYKNYIYRYYERQNEEKIIDNETFHEKEKFLSEKYFFEDTGKYAYANHNDLMVEFCNIVEEPVANVRLILQESKQYNEAKHDAIVPDSRTLERALIEIKKFFVEYISNETEYPSLTIGSFEKESALLNIRTACDNFSDCYSYVFVSGNEGTYSESEAESLFSVDWDLFISFDPYTQEYGLYDKYIRLKQHGTGAVKLLESNENSNFNRSVEEAHWIIANGINEKENSISTTEKDWRKKHGKHLTKMLQSFKSTYTKTIKMFVSEKVPSEFLEEFIQRCIESFFDEKEDTCKGIEIFVLNGIDRLVADDESVIERVGITDAEFLEFLKTGVKSISYDEEDRVLPGIAIDSSLTKNLRNQLKNFCEVLYEGIEKEDPTGSVYDYYRGDRAIYWNELNNAADVKRTEYERRLKDTILDILGKQPYNYHEISYKPGFGGTTLLRRIAWDFHGFYPTLVLFRYEKEDSNVLKQFALKLAKPLFILMDSNYIKHETVQKVVSDLKSWNESHLVIYMNRIRSNDLSRNKSTLFVLPELDERSGEINRFVDVLEPYIKKEICRKRLYELKREPEKIEERSPFYLALTAYDEDFVGIRQYIRNYMSVLSQDYRKFLVYLAIADYINKPIDIQYFANVLHTDTPESSMQVNTAFSSLVTYVHTNDRQIFCKLRFPATGTEILKQATNGFSANDSEDIRFINLTEYIIDFIKSSNITEEIPNRNIVDFLFELLITRHEDLDSSRAQFSDVITRIGTGAGFAAGKQWTDEGQAAVERIFATLVKAYRNDSHFKAHLARFKSYIQKDYNGALKIIDEAIEIEKENGRKDSLLLHMKGMVYATRITTKYIPEIKAAKYENNIETVDEKLREVQIDLHEAEMLFKEVREIQKGVAGHISDISLCINVIDMGRALEEKDTALFLTDHHDDWYMDLADRANILYDECLEYKEELDPVLDKSEIDKINEIGGGISTIRNGIDKTIELYQTFLEDAPEHTRGKLRRHLARAYEERNGRKDWAAISDLMKANIQEDPNNESNIRMWFKAILHLKNEDPEDILREAVMLLNRWINNDERNLEAHYYRYILTYIEAVETISGAENRLKEYQLKMKDLAQNRPSKTSIRYWLGNSGRGIERLIHKSAFPLSEPARANKMLKLLKGRVSLKYLNDKHAYIDAYKTEVFFNPSQTDGRISEINKNQLVVFGVGFSYDGPRAYNSSVELFTGSEMLPETELEPLKRGTPVHCQVLSTKKENYIDVKILEYNEMGSIHINELAEPYSSLNRPRPNGPILNAWAIRKISVNVAGGGNRIIWELSMHQPDARISYNLGEVFAGINIGDFDNNSNIEEDNDSDVKRVEEKDVMKQTAGSVNFSAGEKDDSAIEEMHSSKEGEVIAKESPAELEFGKTYIMKNLKYNKKSVEGDIIIDGVLFKAFTPSCAKKTLERMKKEGCIRVRVVQKSGEKYIAKPS